MDDKPISEVLDEVEAYCEKATEAPSTFAARARTDLPRLVRELRQMREREQCVYCQSVRKYCEGHRVLPVSKEKK